MLISSCRQVFIAISAASAPSTTMASAADAPYTTMAAAAGAPCPTSHPTKSKRKRAAHAESSTTEDEGEVEYAESGDSAVLEEMQEKLREEEKQRVEEAVHPSFPCVSKKKYFKASVWIM